MTGAGQAPGDEVPGGEVIVVGGGITGLAAAFALVRGGARVTLLEASERLGGKLHADDIAGVTVDMGAESMLARRPEAVRLAREAGLAEDLRPPATTRAALWTRDRLRPMPRGHLMGVPGDLSSLASSGVLSAAGLARLPLDHLLPRTPLEEDAAVGEYVAARLGHEVVDRLVEPLLGGVFAGNSYRLSMRAVVPQLYQAARGSRSLIAGVRQAQSRAAAAQAASAQTASAQAGAGQTAAGEAPVFMGIRGGIGRLPLAVADACRAAGARIHTRTEVRELSRTERGWRAVCQTPDGRSVLDADAIVLAAPAPAAAGLLRPHSPAAAAELAAVDYASMALVIMAFRRRDVPGLPDGSGFLVPPVDHHAIKAATFSSNKWGWVAESDPDTFVLRTSIGRFGEEADLARDDSELVRLSRLDLEQAVGLTASPVATRVRRWEGGLPQYPVGHLDRIDRIRAEVAALGGIAVCGALYEGVGIPACVASAERAAAQTLAALGARRAGAGDAPVRAGGPHGEGADGGGTMGA